MRRLCVVNSRVFLNKRRLRQDLTDAYVWRESVVRMGSTLRE